MSGEGHQVVDLRSERLMQTIRNALYDLEQGNTASAKNRLQYAIDVELAQEPPDDARGR